MQISIFSLVWSEIRQFQSVRCLKSSEVNSVSELVICIWFNCQELATKTNFILSWKASNVSSCFHYLEWRQCSTYLSSHHSRVPQPHPKCSQWSLGFYPTIPMVPHPHLNVVNETWDSFSPFHGPTTSSKCSQRNLGFYPTIPWAHIHQFCEEV